MSPGDCRYKHWLKMLTNPTYGGAYAFGKTRTIVRIENGRKRLYSGTHVNREDWQVLIVRAPCGLH